MAFKVVLFFAFIAVASAGLLQSYEQPTYYHQPAAAVVKHVQVQHEEPANYQFNYDVHDQSTGDIKQQSETAQNGAISGQYSLIDSDGYRRTVDYTADDHHGFNAQVRREPLEGHKIVKVAQPAIAVHSAPVQHQYVHSAPAHSYSAPSYYHH